MKQLFYALTLFLAAVCADLSAQTMVTDADLTGSSNVTWTLSGSPYLLNGLVFLETGGKLTIEAGVVVKGIEVPTNGDFASALIITRGAQIFANGTANAPIIFTAEIDDTNDPNDLSVTDRGLWGGLIILGNGNISDDACPQSIEGLPAGDPRGLYGECTNPVEDENSGTLRFVSIRHGGAALAPGNEINGLTLGAVGSGTTLEFIEVVANLDDGIELFGGTAQLKNISLAFCGDDELDYDTGWRGKGQFIFALVGDDEGDNGGEHDGAIPDANTPFSQPVIYNATYIGSPVSSNGLLMRDGTGGTYANSIITGFSNGVSIEQNDSQPVDCLDRINNGELSMLNNLFWNNGTYYALTGSDMTTVPNHLSNNGNSDSANPGISSISYLPNNQLDPRPQSGGPAYQNLASIPGDFYVPVPFKGAFGGNLWLRGWTALDEYGFLPVQNEIVVKDADLTETSNVTWTSDNVYLLDGLVFLETGGKLTIEAGTVIKGIDVPSTGDFASALIITRGAQICANGTAQQPIIFTAQVDDVTDPTDLLPTDRGFWGGLIILGNGNIADDACPQAIEGLPVGDPRGLYGNCTNPNETESSGNLNFVSIRHGGAALAPGNEINGLSLGAVGSGTIIENIEIFANLDDGIEFFGGTVSIKGAAVSFCGDDCFDWDTGWRGKGQYWFALVGDDEGDNGGEHDGAIPDANTPFSQPVIYNATYIGSSASSNALLMRDATGGTYANSIFTKFSNGIQIEQNDGQPVDCLDRLANGEINILNNIWWDFSGSLVTFSGSDVTTVPAYLVANGNVEEDPMLGGISYTTDGNLNPQPSTSGPAFPAADQLASIPADAFFSENDWKGAFCDQGVWIAGWTALSQYGILDNSLNYVEPSCGFVGVEDIFSSSNGYVLAQNYPNPVHNKTTIYFVLPASTEVSLEVIDFNGRTVSNILQKERLTKGEHYFEFDASGLPKGNYLYTLKNQEVVLTKQFTVN